MLLYYSLFYKHKKACEAEIHLSIFKAYALAQTYPKGYASY